MTWARIATNSHGVDERYDSNLTSFSHVPPYLKCFAKAVDKIKHERMIKATKKDKSTLLLIIIGYSILK